jgi:hypothetical protein
LIVHTAKLAKMALDIATSISTKFC